MGKYVVSYDEKAHSINIDLSGVFTEENVRGFVTDFMAMSKKFKTSDTCLILDSTRLFFYPCEVFEKFKGIFEMYRDTGYKLVRVKLYKPQKEMGRKILQLAKSIGLQADVIYMQ